ncbi:MAG TPA: hypothetical protein VM509_07450 [Planctomycetota bacterium]|nr:hypothetical protein [Planctomycetota bacterium]
MTLVTDTETLSTIASLAVGTGLVAGTLFFVVRSKSRERDKRQALWQRFALDNRLHLDVGPDSLFDHGELRIQGRIGEQEVELSTYRVKVGKSRQTWARVASRVDGARGSFTVQRANLIHRAGALFGAKGVSIDKGAFDEQFLTRSEPETLARTVLDERLRAHFASLTRRPRLVCEDGVCELSWHCGEESLEQLARAVELHALLRTALARANRA